MLTLKKKSVDEVWHESLRIIMETGNVVETRIGRSIELQPAILQIEQPRRRILHLRTYNIAYGYAEFLWIMKGENSLKFLQQWNPRMNQYSDDGLTLHGAYGHRLKNAFSIDQLYGAFHELSARPESRQVVLQIWDPRLDFPTAGPTSKDVACSLLDHLLVRSGKLEWMHVMRSNDIIWGTPYDILVFTNMQEVLAGWLGLEVGNYTHIAGTIHVYERHWSYAKKLIGKDVITSGKTDDLRLSYAEFSQVLDEIWDILVRIMDTNSANEIISLWSKSKLPKAYWNILTILVSDTLCRRGAIQQGMEVANECSNQSQKFALAKWFRGQYEGFKAKESKDVI